MRILLIITVLTLVACGRSEQTVEQTAGQTESAATVAPNKEDMATPESLVTIKPGAAIVFTSNYAGTLQVGEFAPLMIQLQPQYAAGQLNVSFSVPSGLSVQGQTQYSESFVGPQEFIYELMVGSEVAGDYNLGIIVSVVTDSGLEEARAFAEVISVTDPLAVQAVKLLDSGELKEIEEQAEHFMEAQEEIISGP
jgi:hypothetical protein